MTNSFDEQDYKYVRTIVKRCPWYGQYDPQKLDDLITKFSNGRDIKTLETFILMRHTCLSEYSYTGLRNLISFMDYVQNVKTKQLFYEDYPHNLEAKIRQFAKHDIFEDAFSSTIPSESDILTQVGMYLVHGEIKFTNQKYINNPIIDYKALAEYYVSEGIYQLTPIGNLFCRAYFLGKRRPRILST